MDFTKTYLALDPQIRAEALMGKYMHYFAGMENQLDEAIRASFSLSGAKSAILCANLAFSDKVQTLRTLNHTYTGSDGMMKANDKRLNKVMELAVDRNLAAHAQFTASEKERGGIVLFKSRAAGKLILEDVEWSILDVGSKCNKLVNARNFLIELTVKLPLSIIQTEKLQKTVPEAATSKE